MTLAVVQPWGQSPTPLLPKAIVQKFGHLEAPQYIIQLLGKRATLADLPGVWDHAGSVDRKCLSDLVNILKPHVNAIGPLLIYSGEKQSWSLESLPFSTRTGHAINNNPEIFSSGQLSFRDILSVRNFGFRSAIEFSCVIEAALQSAAITPFTSDSETEQRAEDGPKDPELYQFLKALSAWALGEENIRSLGDVLPSAPSNWPEEVQELWILLGEQKTERWAGDWLDRYSVPILISRGLASLDDRMLEIAKERVLFIGRSLTLEELGQKYNITRERIRQIESKVVSKLERFRNSEFAPVLRRALRIRSQLGAAVPQDAEDIDKVLMGAVEDIVDADVHEDMARALLFWLAGPYYLSENWLIADKDLKETVLGALLEKRDSRGFIEKHIVSEVLNRHEVNPAYHSIWLDWLGKFLDVEGGIILFEGGILDKAEALLNFYGRPMTAEEIMEYVDSDSVRSVRQRLIDDPRFWRINKQNEFVLAGHEGYDEYTGIVDEIVQELEACGGGAPFDHLVDKLSRTYGVKENSIVAYLSTPMFFKDEHGIVRVRQDHDDVVVETDISKTTGCYRTQRGQWCWRVEVDQQLLRGSGRLLPNAFAQQLGCNLGDKLDVPSECGKVTLSWPLSSTTGATIGSLRQAIFDKGADIGDYLFVVASKPQICFIHLEAKSVVNAVSNLVRVAHLLGRKANSEDQALAEISHALDVEADTTDSLISACRQALISKGEKDIAELIDRPKLSVDDYIEDMGKLFS